MIAAVRSYTAEVWEAWDQFWFAPSNPATLSKPSMCRPSEVTLSSSIRPSAIPDRPVCAWLPAVIRKAMGRPRACIVMLQAMLEDWVMIAAPRSPAASLRPPCWSGHSSAPSA